MTAKIAEITTLLTAKKFKGSIELGEMPELK
eukprot:CAMPEP_0170479606 /NCGR_PEP_ID=MMETSP0208-20121228/776_1 /TAXON_ID=197538 /ORGANISM="Strombidium inclinatum, Strain S3" /LENGTH=30 /DNA_ID= /DNA_START= /DNA_END= /DNA_ORIENTATION=